jgi:hypothetical protein
MVDASADHVGEALQQRTGPATAWQPLGFFSKKLDQTQLRYSAYDRELLACMLVSGISSSCWRAGSSYSTPTISH